MAPQSGNSHILQQTLLIHQLLQFSLENDQETIIPSRQYHPVSRNEVYMRSHIFLDHDRWFFVFVLLLVIEQPVDVLVPDNAVDQDLLVDCFFGIGKGCFWVQTDLELRWVDGFVLGFGVSKRLLNGGRQWIALFELDHVKERPDFLRDWLRVSVFLLMINHMSLSPERPSPLTSALLFMQFSSVVLLGHRMSVLCYLRQMFTGLFNIIGSKLLLFDLQYYSYNCHLLHCFLYGDCWWRWPLFNCQRFGGPFNFLLLIWAIFIPPLINLETLLMDLHLL